MGVDITFTHDHKLRNISMADVPRRYNAMNDLFVEVANYWSLAPPMEPWRDAGAFNQGEPFYQAPAGFSFSFGPAAVCIHHCCRFRVFTGDLQARTLLRRFVRRSCELLSGDRTIYAPDEGVGETIHSLVMKGCSVADIEAKLLRLSPPALTFEELDERQCPPWTQPAYYVDTILARYKSQKLSFRAGPR